MFRVLETIRHSEHAGDFAQQQANLTFWIEEIITAAWHFQVRSTVFYLAIYELTSFDQKPNGTLYNYINETDTSFADSASTALLAASTYRFAALTGKTSLIPAANKALQLVDASLNATGWLTNMVDPLTFNTPAPSGGDSPEGQSFVLLLHSAWRDYISLLS